MLSLLSLSAALSFLQVSWAVNVYLYPPQTSLKSSLSPDDASLALSHHLGLEIFESLRDSTKYTYDVEQSIFVGEGQKDAVLLTLEDSDVQAVLPPSIRPSFKLSMPSSTSVSSLSSVLSTYLHRARHVYSSVYDSVSADWHPSEIPSLQSFLQNAHDSTFAALDLSGLASLRTEYGVGSAEYTAVTDPIRTFLQNAVSEGKLKLAILTYSPDGPTHAKRQTSAFQSQAPFPSQAPPQQPISSVSTCFQSSDACNNATSTCFGRGQCVEATKSGKTCFVCACSATKTGEGNKVKTETWVGESCERKDISGPFVLFTGTALVMIILAIGSVSLLYNVGEQLLPPTLTGTAVHSKRD